ncbi:hypothetical protein [Aeromicrobium sp. UC242_57]|uniref:hypothetical protein n=1 Tax=Aeromicrobium sp. UC242_57 TaxID=3374624 RepID=UPI00379C7165
MLAAVELRGPVNALPKLPPGVRIFVEQPWGSGFDIPAGTLLKLRCGGAVVPTIGQLGAAIAHCVEHTLPFKLTAGLHHAVVSDTGHGFVNVLAAVDAALAGEDPVPVLAQRDPEGLFVRDPAAVRRLFLSIGTCDIDEPLTDLRALGWLA